MSVRRVMGTETEFGISVQGQPTANPMVASSQVVNAYATSTLRARRARWDFEEESPLRDARGFDMSRESADPTQLTDEDLGLANVILTNGARLYVDRRKSEIRLVDIALLPELRRRGAGTRLIVELQREAEASGRTLTIHVERFNPARALYDRLGFREIGEAGEVYRLLEWRPVS